jgi:hypothetical protein
MERVIEQISDQRGRANSLVIAWGHGYATEALAAVVVWPAAWELGDR